MSNKQAAHHHDDEAKMKTSHSMLWPSRVVTWPFRFIKQTLSDCQSGRNMRKRITQELEPRAGDDQRCELEDETDKQQDGHETPASATGGLSPRKYYDKSTQKNEQHRSVRIEVVEHWVHQAGEWPWRVEHVVQRDPSKNWRVFSVLEVNDFCYYAMQSGEKVKLEDIVVPRTHWLFPHQETSENEADELMDYLTRP
ncbi:hypothetical protein F4680DRAFT_445021 [Xylaria scruposa]|nr:hypothetical protein F4680DRAFT_445021 [Xylaria scruposa]